MTEKTVAYVTGAAEPEHQWIECSARVPNLDREGESEIQCKAKVRCDDVIDALDLDRWSAIAFQHLWRSGRTTTSRREKAVALWYLKRATYGHHAEARTVARVLRHLVEIADSGEGDLRRLLLEFARDAEMAEFGAIELIHSAVTKDH